MRRTDTEPRSKNPNIKKKWAMREKLGKASLAAALAVVPVGAVAAYVDHIDDRSQGIVEQYDLGYPNPDKVVRTTASIDFTAPNEVVVDGKVTPAVWIKMTTTPLETQPGDLSRPNVTVSLAGVGELDLSGFSNVAPEVIDPSYRPLTDPSSTEMAIPLADEDGVYTVGMGTDVRRGDYEAKGGMEYFTVVIEDGKVDEVATNEAREALLSPNGIQFYDPDAN